MRDFFNFVIVFVFGFIEGAFVSFAVSENSRKLSEQYLSRIFQTQDSNPVSQTVIAWLNKDPTNPDRLFTAPHLHRRIFEFNYYPTAEELNFNGLSFTDLPKKLPIDVEKITRFFACRNCLTKVPKSVSHFRSLEMLDLSSNKIKVIPKWIGQLTELKFLSLSRNELTSIPKEIGLLQSLKVMNLFQHKLQTLPYALMQLPIGCRIHLNAHSLCVRPNQKLAAVHFRGVSYAALPEATVTLGFEEALEMLCFTALQFDAEYPDALHQMLQSDPEFYDKICCFIPDLLLNSHYKCSEVNEFNMSDAVLRHLRRAVQDDCFRDVFKAVLNTHGKDVPLVLLHMFIQNELINFDREDLPGLAALIVQSQVFLDLAEELFKRQPLCFEHFPSSIEAGLEFVLNTSNNQELEAFDEHLEQLIDAIGQGNRDVFHSLLLAEVSWLLALQENNPEGWDAVEAVIEENGALTNEQERDLFLPLSQTVLNAALYPAPVA